MKVAAAQISCVLGDFDANIRKIRDFGALAKKSGAELVVFPEMSDTGYSMPVIQKQARPWKDGAVSELQKIAKENSIAIVAGISDRNGDSIFNAQVLVDVRGEIVAKYRKTHLVTAAPLDERDCRSFRENSGRGVARPRGIARSGDFERGHRRRAQSCARV